MNRWGRIVWGLALVAGAAWVVAGLVGLRVVDGPTLARHTLLAFAALLALALTHLWVGVYLLVFARKVRDLLPPDSSRCLAAARRQGVAAAALAVSGAAVQFMSANALYPARLDNRWHALAGLSSVLLLALAASWERRALREAGRVAASASRSTV